MHGTWAAKHVNKNIKIRIGIWILALSRAVAFLAARGSVFLLVLKIACFLFKK
jgi:hypothetical protein